MEKVEKQEFQKVEEEQTRPLFSTAETLIKDSIINTKKLFASNQSCKAPDFFESSRIGILAKLHSEYKQVLNENQLDQQQEGTKIVDNIQKQQNQQQVQFYNEQQRLLQEKEQEDMEEEKVQDFELEHEQKKSKVDLIIEQMPQKSEKISRIPEKFLKFTKQTQDFDNLKMITDGSGTQNPITSNTLSIPNPHSQQFSGLQSSQVALVDKTRLGTALSSKITKVVKPEWHRPWKLMRVIAGHKGWIRAIAVDPGNQYFVTGGTDRTIKFWDLASGQLKITITGHISPIRGLFVSPKHPYLFSCSEDKTVRCWDLEMNQIIRVYQGHLSGVYGVTMHPTLDILVSGGRDSVVRLWDIRMRAQINVLSGHEHTVSSVLAQEFQPQVISGSHDQTVRTWDIAAGKYLNVLTNHKKAVRALVLHPKEYTWASAAADNIKVWKCPEGKFLRNVSGHNAIVNTLAVNQDNVLVSGSDDGQLKFWDWKSGYNFQTILQKPQPGSIAAENGIFCMTFDRSSMRLLTGECDKTIKVYKEDETATPETHPIRDFKVEYSKQI